MMKNLRYVFLVAVLPLAFNVNAQVKPAPALKLDTVLVKKQAKIEPLVSYVKPNVVPAANATSVNPASVVKTTMVITPGFNFKSNVVMSQPGSIHPTPLQSTTFQPVMITSPGGTVSSINNQGFIFKKN